MIEIHSYHGEAACQANERYITTPLDQYDLVVPLLLTAR
jgi:hypothetical protein